MKQYKFKVTSIKVFCALVTAMVFASFTPPQTLKGIYEYQGGSSNGKIDGAPKGYTLRRNYTDKDFNAFVIEKGTATQKYEAGTYKLKMDTCVETETFSSQPSKLMNIPVHYHYRIIRNTLILTGKLPSGTIVIEYWKKVK